MIGAEAVRSITANLSTTVAATVTVLIGMFLVGLLIGFGSWARSWSDHIKDKLLVKVFFCTESTCAKPATEKQIDAIASSSSRTRRFGRRRRLRHQGAGARADEEDAIPDLVEDLAFNPLPDAFEVHAGQGRVHRRRSPRASKPRRRGSSRSTTARRRRTASSRWRA